MQQITVSKVANNVGVHANTLNNWFNSLSQRNIHHLNTKKVGARNTKVYDSLDLKIAIHINRLSAEENIPLDDIFDNLHMFFDLRRIGVDQNEEGLLMMDIPSEQGFTDTEIWEKVADELEKYKQEIHELIRSTYMEIDKEGRIKELRDLHHIIIALEVKALNTWQENNKVKYKWMKIFKKDNSLERDKFVKNYVNDNFSELVNKHILNE
ncbi:MULTISPECIES: hypothetical protein [Bacillaceae]|uniref:HTH merR-type domain-containing protein n=1 Tax=Evansella alkalicola TaxID=745819 RepID=A0ABS6JS00_9BACI|nr:MULTISPECIES: hypothetical protein [Bacillaceae]MBU9721341.1 hypothetical protein [Bacillus alkalicola]